MHLMINHLNLFLYMVTLITKMKFLFCITLFFYTFSLQAESKRVEVYKNGQQFHDVKAGESLSLICQQLRPNSHQAQLKCQQQLFEDNSAAFSGNSPHQLIAGKRLWLPGSYRPVSKLENENYRIRQYSWGSIKTPK